MSTLKNSAYKVQVVLDRFGLELKVVELSKSTRTAMEASEAIGCELGQIAKTLIFKGCRSQLPVCIIISGLGYIDETKLQDILGEDIEKADAAFVAEHTGYVIGGVPPVGHTTKIRTLIDGDILQYSTIWAAAGTPHAVFNLTPDNLVRITQGNIVSISKTRR
jgi:prolyl-tRNA editing enzyme YbaK/EbsC (Cys-tRNA(Pro) deacylase)